jgi:hypothetical protein
MKNESSKYIGLPFALFQKKQGTSLASLTNETTVCSPSPHFFTGNGDYSGCIFEILFTTITEKDISMVINKLNNRPRKCLGFKTPNQVFFGLKPSVALGT